ncbi:efflux RND transporter periplasmic adaptor subunit [Leptobacterium flavescens]|uniref:Efflux RND transporter periplasmic adaptor subunit n=1 Tax=Leptobacterium flavescens TaxID=472055 RepID=A0A6P0UIK9_9FLAO|nr:efflux RND transporter periplasmic adaptor subunit [Leptobacterium flavescens]NER13074.1 efflux RND transporter periplasmic adaptor subunit [Leptobacterium flavescens]
MRKLYISIFATALLASCGGGGSQTSVEDVIAEGNLKTLKSKKKEIEAEQKALEAKIEALNEAIAQKDTVQKLPLVTTFKAKDTVFHHYLELQGSVETKQNIVIFPEMAGILTRVFVKEGQRVRKGQILAKIDDGGLSQQVAQLEVQAQLAKTTYERQKRLWDQKIGSEIQYLQAKTSYESQKNAVDQLKRQLAKTSVTAPFSGVVDDIITEQGSVVAPGQSQLIRIVNLDDMYIQAEIPESYLPSVVKGKEVQVFFPVLGETVKTSIRQAGNYINPNNRSFKIEISVPNKSGNIKPNLTARLKINDYTNEKAILIPQSVISENAEGRQYVYITGEQNGNHVAEAKRSLITTGKTQGDYVEVLSGILNNDDVIEEGARSVKDGQKVEIKNQESEKQPENE